MKTVAFTFLKHNAKIYSMAFLMCTALFILGCSSDDGGGDQMDEMAQEEDPILDFDFLVDTWQAETFFFQESNSSLGDLSVIGNGGSVTLEVMSDGRFVFDFEVPPDEDGFMNSGIFRIEENTLQALFSDDTSYRDLEAEIGESRLTIEGIGIFSLSGQGSKITQGFRGTFFRQE